MLQLINSRLLTPRYNYVETLERRRARALMIYLTIIIPLAILVTYPPVIAGLLAGEGVTIVDAISIVAPLLAVGLYFAASNGYYRGAAVVVVLLSVVAPIPGFQVNTIDSSNMISMAIPIVLAGTLLGRFATVSTTIATSAIVLVFGFVPPFAPDGANLASTAISSLLVFIIIASIELIFGSNIQVAAGQLIEDLLSLERASDSFTLSGIDKDENDLSGQAMDIARDYLGYNFAQVFFVEDDRVRRRVSSGLSRSQLNIDTDFGLSSTSGIYEALRTGEMVVLDQESSEARRGHVLPGINLALAIPLRDHTDTIIAVLDLQSEDTQTVTQERLKIARTLASQLAIAIAESRVISDLRANLAEQNNLIQRQRQRLLEYERAERRATATSWAQYLEQRGIEYIGFDLNPQLGDEPVAGYELTDTLRPAFETGDVSVTTENGHQVITAPIMLRGRVLGAMSFKVPAGRQVVGQRQLELLRSVVQRLALALENKRLFEQSQAQAQRESIANEAGNLLLSTTDVQTVLKLAADNFNEVVGAIQTRIHVQPTAQSSNTEDTA
jgi:GAF domain-containing protein